MPYQIKIMTVPQWKKIIYEYKTIGKLADHLHTNKFTLGAVIYEQTGKYFAQLYADSLAEKQELKDFIRNIYIQAGTGRQFNDKLCKFFCTVRRHIIPYLDETYPNWREWRTPTDTASIIIHLKRREIEPVPLEVDEAQNHQPKKSKSYSKHSIPEYTLKQWKELILETRNIYNLAKKLGTCKETLSQVIPLQTQKRFFEIYIDALAEKNELIPYIKSLLTNNLRLNRQLAEVFCTREGNVNNYLDIHYPEWKTLNISDPDIKVESPCQANFMVFNHENIPSLEAMEPDDEKLFGMFGLD